jgi:hypothetical protein
VTKYTKSTAFKVRASSFIRHYKSLSSWRVSGNEANDVIVTLVRSSSPGFLRSIQRMNVLLTRCRRGLVIVSSKAFLGPGGKGSDTLLGKLVQHWQDQYSRTWIDWRSIANASVDLSGIKARTLNNSMKMNRLPGNTGPSSGTPYHAMSLLAAAK